MVTIANQDEFLMHALMNV